MSSNSFRIEVYLPDFLSSLKFCKEKYPDLEEIDTLNHAFNMTKKIHFRLNAKDKNFLFRCASTI